MSNFGIEVIRFLLNLCLNLIYFALNSFDRPEGVAIR